MPIALIKWQRGGDQQDGSVSAGGDLTARAGHDLNLSGSTLVSKGDTTLAAANDINLNTLDNSSHQTQGNSKTTALTLRAVPSRAAEI